MNIQIESINIIAGEFRLLPPVPGLSDDHILSLGVRYRLEGKNQQVLAEGTATNDPNSAVKSVQLSRGTLQAFLEFTNRLEEDLAGAFQSQEKDHDELAKLLGAKG